MSNQFEYIHTTVLKDETIRSILPSLNLLAQFKNTSNPELCFVDATLGGGGHSVHLCHLLSKQSFFHDFNILIIAFDQDEIAITHTAKKLKEITLNYPNIRFEIIHDNFSNMTKQIQDLKKTKMIHALYADFGVSSPQLDCVERGFSFQSEGPLDMRMNQQNLLTARQILENYSEADLVRIFFDYGEEPKARKLAKAIVIDRTKSNLALYSTKSFAEYVARVLAYPNNSRVHSATRVFQALRIEVNDELKSIETLVKDIPQWIHPLGKASFITFHSLEDRLIKHAMRNWQKGKSTEENKSLQRQKDHLISSIPPHILSLMMQDNLKAFGHENPRGGIIATKEECQLNSRARSARLRCFHFDF